MRAVGVLCLQLFGEGKAPEIKDEIALIATKDFAALDWKAAPKESLYGWYYATQAMFQEGGKLWGAWNRKFQAVIGNNQNAEGYWEYPGTFHGGAVQNGLNQKVYATTLCGLMLTVYYRYLPSGKGGAGAKVKAKPEAAEEEVLDLTE